MSEWAPPSSSDFPGQPTDGIDALLRKVERIKRELDDATNNLLKAAGMSVGPDGLTIDSELLVTGATRIEGTLSLPAGIIDNDALANPVKIVGASGATLGFGLPAVNTVLHSEPIVVPVGYTEATVEVTSTVSYLGNAAEEDSYVRCQAGVNSTFGTAQTAYLYMADAITMSAKAVVNLTGLTPGDTIYGRASGYALAGSQAPLASNTAHVAVVAFFTR